MNARIDAEGQQVTEGNQVDIGHHYISLSRKEFGLEKVSPIDYQIPDEDRLRKPMRCSSTANLRQSMLGLVS